MSSLEQKVEDLKLTVSDKVGRCLVFNLRNDTNARKKDADFAYGRYEPAYKETELLDIYQDLLSTQTQAPEPVESATNKFGGRMNDQTLVDSLIGRLDKRSPSEPGTSQSHVMDVDSQEPVARYRKVVSQLVTVLQDPDAATERHDPSSSENEAKQQILPSPLEWTALIRECVSTLWDDSPVDLFCSSRSA